MNKRAENLNFTSFLHSILTYIATFPPPTTKSSQKKSFISQINYLILDFDDMKEPVNKNPEALIFVGASKASELYLRGVTEGVRQWVGGRGQ